MDVTTLTFGVKDVVEIGIGIIAIVSVIFKMRSNDEKNIMLAKEALDEAKKVDTKLALAVSSVRTSVNEKETHLYGEIEKVRSEQKDSHARLSEQISNMNGQLTTINKGLSELTGYIKGKDSNQ